MNVSYPAGALTKLARVFMSPSNNGDTLKAQAYMMSAAANRDRDLAAMRKTDAETAELTARNQARTPEAMQAAAVSGMGMSPQAPQAVDLLEAFRTGRNPVTPAQPAVTLPNVSDSPLGSFNLEDVIRKPSISIEELAPAIPQQERPVDATQLQELARRVGDFMGMQAATGDTNYEQFQGGVGEGMKNQLLQKALAGQQLTPQELSILKAGAIFNSQGINNFSGQGGEAFGIDQEGEMQRERIQSGDRRYGDNVRAASSRYGTDVGAVTSRRNNDQSQATERWKHTTLGANKPSGKGKDTSAADMDAINEIDLTDAKFEPQVPKSDPDYAQFYRLYGEAHRSGDTRKIKMLVHRALKNGLVKRIDGDK